MLLYYIVLYYITVAIRVNICDKIKILHLILNNICYILLLISIVLRPKRTHR